MNALGIIFSSIHNETIDELTRKRTSASIPFGAKYRIIDFVLSNFVNADITNVGVLTQKNYQSLMDHIGSGRDWDLARKNGGLIVFPPYSSFRSDFLYETRLEALISIKNFIEKSKEEYVVLTDCDSVNVVDYEEVITSHIKNNADVTLIYKTVKVESDLAEHTSIVIDKNNKIIGGTLHSKTGTKANVALNIWVINRKLLANLLDDAKTNGAKSFNRDVVFANIQNLNIFGYEYKGTYLHLNNMENYFKGNMKMLEEKVRTELFSNPEKRIYTKVRDSAPTKFGDNAVVEDCFIADGCEIEGTVKNSILFRGVKIAKGTVVENCILMQDTIVEKNCHLDYCVADKNVVIRSGNDLKGCIKVPYYVSKSQII